MRSHDISDLLFSNHVLLNCALIEAARGCQWRGQNQAMYQFKIKMLFTDNQSSYPPTSTLNTLLQFSAESVGKTFEGGL